jgi:hypothetical protein
LCCHSGAKGWEMNKANDISNHKKILFKYCGRSGVDRILTTERGDELQRRTCERDRRIQESIRWLALLPCAIVMMMDNDDEVRSAFLRLWRRAFMVV